MLNIYSDYPTWSARPARQRSGEVDFGVWWRLAGARTTWRVSWIEDTGELYAVELLNKGDGPRYVRLGRYPTRAAVEAAMQGWTEPTCPFFHDIEALADHLGGAHG